MSNAILERRVSVLTAVLGITAGSLTIYAAPFTDSLRQLPERRHIDNILVSADFDSVRQLVRELRDHRAD